MRKKREREKMEREWGNGEREIFIPSPCIFFPAIASPFSFFISSFSHSLSISSPFPHSLAIVSLYFVIFSQFSHSLSISLHFLILSPFSLSLVMNNIRSPLYWGSFLKGSVHKNASKMHVAPWSPMDGM